MPLWAMKIARPGMDTLKALSGEQTPLMTFMKDNVPQQVLGVITVGSDHSRNQLTSFRTHEEAAAATQESSQVYVVTQEPYSDTKRVVQVTREELAAGQCRFEDADNRPQYDMPRQGQEPLAISVLGDPNNQMAQPTTLNVGMQYGQLAVGLGHTRPDAFAVVM